MNILRNRHALLAFGMTTCMIMGVNGIVPMVPLLLKFLEFLRLPPAWP